MEERKYELYGGPLDGLSIEVPEQLNEMAKAIALPIDPDPPGGYWNGKSISPEFEGNVAVYVRHGPRKFRFKEMTDDTNNVAKYD